MFQAPVGHLRKKTVRRFPLTTTDWNQAFGGGVTAPANIWGMGESAFNLVDLVGGKDFTNGGGTIAFRDTNDPLRPYAVRCTTNATRIFTANTGDFDDPGTSFSWFGRLKMGISASSRILLGKKATSAGNDGWRLGSTISGQLINFFDSAGAAATTLTSTSNHNDGNFHDFMIVYDRSGANLARLVTDLDNMSVSMGAHSSFSNAASFGLGDANSASAGAQQSFSYLAYWPSTALSVANFTTLTSLS